MAANAAEASRVFTARRGFPDAISAAETRTRMTTPSTATRATAALRFESECVTISRECIANCPASEPEVHFNRRFRGYGRSVIGSGFELPPFHRFDGLLIESQA